MSKGIVIECKYQEDNGEKTCSVQKKLITSSEHRVVTRIKGEDRWGFTPKPNFVTGFSSCYDDLIFFPRNLTYHFNNLKIIKIQNSKLKKITKEDLKEFGDKLECLKLPGNKIKDLEVDLFEFNRNLEEIDFSKNKIKKIDAKTFNGLEKLKTLDLKNNPCTSESDWVTNYRSEVLKLIQRVEVSYPFITAKNEEIATLRSELSEKKSEIYKLKLKLKKQSKEIETLKDNSERILEKEADNLKLKEKVKKLEDKNEELKIFMREKYQEQEVMLQNLVEAQIVSTNSQSDDEKIDLNQKFNEINEKFEKLTSKIDENAKKTFEKFENDQKKLADAQEKILNTNMEKFNENFKNINEELKELKKFIDPEKATKY